jgi:hypothetical protein
MSHSLCHEDVQCICLNKEKEQHQKERRRGITIFVVTIIAFIITIMIGTIVYVFLFGLPWIDAFYNAAVVLTAINVDINPLTVGQKLFIIVYAFVSVVLLLSLANAVMERIFDIFIYSD